MRYILTYVLVRNLSRINIDCLFKKPINNRHITNKPENKPNLDINEHKHILYYSLSL
jgi:hypothetical protein